ncbi:hypothetical protein K7432_004168 [Basidiobolus ranarum]|uniref:CS domain-containing protein n=1 Tax=Basidiobolus ranarum TaxID=34480 RepID=A0ABR2WYR9_9FUNG
MSLPVFHIRQTLTHVTILVDVPEIQEESIQVKNDRNHIDLTFVDANEHCYSLPLDFDREIEPSGIKTNVCQANLILLIQKLHPGEWTAVCGEQYGKKYFLTESRIRELITCGELECPWSMSNLQISSVEVDRSNPDEALEFEVRF